MIRQGTRHWAKDALVEVARQRNEAVELLQMVDDAVLDRAMRDGWTEYPYDVERVRAFLLRAGSQR